MTKQEAIHLMREGEKVTHRYFSDNEWMKLTPTGMYEFEDGCICATLQFWQDRRQDYWDKDWSIFNQL